MDPNDIPALRDEVNERFCKAVMYLLENKLARNKNEIMNRLGLYLGRLSLLLEHKANVSSDNLANLANVYGVSADYLLLGREPIMATNVRSEAPELPDSGMLPLIPMSALAGFNGFDEGKGFRREDCVHYYVPEFVEAGADFLIKIKGSSMTPTYVSGDLVACRQASTETWLDYGEAYVIDGMQGIMLKRIYNDPANPDTLVCKSDNPDVAPFSINKDEIRSLSKVVGVIRNA